LKQQKALFTTMVETTNSPFITKDVRLKQQITPFTTKVETTKKTIHHQD
jgi:hypothetical protein